MLSTLAVLVAIAAGEPHISPLTLTPDERTWLADHPRVRVHFEAWPPFLLEQDGRPAGITVDYLELIAGELGFEIEWVRTHWSEALTAMRAGETIDLLPLLTRSREREEFLEFTGVYVSFPIVIFSRVDTDFIGGLDDLRGRRVVVERDFAMHTRLERDLPEQPLTIVATTAAALEAIATGRADAYLGHLAVGSHVIQKLGLANVKVAAPAPYGTHDQAMGVRRDWPELARLLDRGLASITPRGHDRIRQRWLAVQYARGVRHRDVWLWSLGAVLALAMAWWVRRHRRELRQRRRAEAALEKSRYQLVEAEKLTNVGSWTYDRDANTITWSPETFRLMGRSPELGAPALDELDDLFGHDWPRLERAITAALDHDRAYELELSVRRSTAEVRTMVCRGTRAPGSDAAELIGSFQDITDLRRAANQREQLQSQLRAAQKLESIGSLAGGIASDFNNLLVTIRGSTELVLEDLPDGFRGRDDLAEVLTATESATELCRQMLSYSGEASLVLDQLDLSSVVRGMSRMLDVSLSKKATVELDLTEGLPAVDADPAQLQQVVLNLTLNASEALGNEVGIIAITTASAHCTAETFAAAYPPDLPAGTYVTLTVSDTGCGMDARTREQIYDPFFSTKAAGRGMGMAAVLGIVRAHRGAIRIESEVTRGTTVTVWFPRADERELQETPPTVARTANNRRPTVLVVDDNDGVRRTARRALSRRGFDILEAANGRLALEVIAEHDEIGCVILDITMPEMDGVETYQALMKVRPELPVVMTSGFHSHDRVERTGDHPLAFVQKPFDVKTLVAAVRRALEHEP